MDTDTKIAEVQKTTDTSSKNVSKEDSYKIFDYFKGHTGLLVTCISALVAIISFILHFAVGRMNYAYLEYWNIAPLYANTNNQNELYLVVCAMLYLLALMLIHGLLSRTSDVFRYYNKLLSTMKQAIKVSRKLNRRLRKRIRTLCRKMQGLSPEARRYPAWHEINSKTEEYKGLLAEALDAVQAVKKRRGKLRKKVSIRIVCTILLSCLIGCLFATLGSETVTFKKFLQSSLLVIASVATGCLLYFLPAYFATRCSRKQYKTENVIEKIRDLLDSGIPDFPIEKIAKKGVKPIFSDKMLKFAAVQVVVVTVILLFTMSATGTASAKLQRSFPIYIDDSTSYAIVYISDSTVFMEEAVEQNGTLVIDTTKQRIVTSDDISYDIAVFDNVSVIKNDDTLEFDQNIFSVRDVIDDIGSFLETLQTGDVSPS